MGKCLGNQENTLKNQDFLNSGMRMENASFAIPCKENVPFLKSRGWQIFLELGAARYVLFLRGEREKKVKIFAREAREKGAI